MSFLSQSPVQRGGTQPPDDVDGLLRAFFKAQMPHPWPSPAALSPPRILTLPVARATKGWPLMRSRLALAVAVALLAFGFSLFLLYGTFQGPLASEGNGIRVKGLNASRTNNPLQNEMPPRVEFPSEFPLPNKVKIEESLIQDSGGAVKAIKVDVIDWPMPPK